MNKMIPDFYFTDRRLGDVVFINGKDAYREYNADLIGDTESPGTITNEVRYRPGNSKYFIHNQEIEPAIHEFSFFVGGKTRADALHNVSALLSACRACEIEREDDPWKYKCVMQSYTKEETGVDYFYLVTVVEEVLKVGEEVSMTITADNPPGVFTVFENPGTAEAGLYVKYIDRNSTARTISIHNSTITSDSITFSTDGTSSYYEAVFDPNNAIVTRQYVSIDDFVKFIPLAPGTNRLQIRIDSPTISGYELTLACVPVFL